MNKPLTQKVFELTPAQWQASLDLGFTARQNETSKKTRLARCRHKGPLYVQKPFYPEGDELSHVYILHPPGGIVSGDHLHIDVDVDEQAQALITTPGAGRIYRAREDRLLQQQSIDMLVADNASLEWMPLETIVFNDANVKLNTCVKLQGNATFIGWEVTCLGLLARGEAFSQGSLRQSFEIYRDEKPVYIERLHLDQTNNQALQQSPIGFDNKTVSGFFVFATQGIDEEHIESARESLTAMNLEVFVDLSQVSNDCLVIRYLGDSAEQARAIFVKLWAILRPIYLQREACPARIWAT